MQRNKKPGLQIKNLRKKFGFKVVDTTDNGYELLALSFDESFPKFADNAKKMEIDQKELTIFYDLQCPYIYQTMEKLKNQCEKKHVSVIFYQIDSLEKAKQLPCVFNNWAAFYDGKFETVNLLAPSFIDRILKKKANE